MNVDKAEEYRQIMSNMGIDVSNYQVGNMYDWTLGGLFDDSLNMGASNGWRGVYTNNETLGSRKGVASDTLSLYFIYASCASSIFLFNIAQNVTILMVYVFTLLYYIRFVFPCKRNFVFQLSKFRPLLGTIRFFFYIYNIC